MRYPERDIVNPLPLTCAIRQVSNCILIICLGNNVLAYKSLTSNQTVKRIFSWHGRGNHTPKLIPIGRIAKSWQGKRERLIDLTITETCLERTVALRYRHRVLGSHLALNTTVGFSQLILARHRDSIKANIQARDVSTPSPLFAEWKIRVGARCDSRWRFRRVKGKKSNRK